MAQKHKLLALLIALLAFLAVFISAPFPQIDQNLGLAIIAFSSVLSMFMLMALTAENL